MLKTEQFFMDLNGFIRSSNQLKVFSDQEIYRLRMLVTKVRAALFEDDDSFHEDVHFILCCVFLS